MKFDREAFLKNKELNETLKRKFKIEVEFNKLMDELDQSFVANDQNSLPTSQVTITKH